MSTETLRELYKLLEVDTIEAETTLTNDDCRLYINKIRDILYTIIPRTEIGGILQALFSTDKIYYRKLGHNSKIMDDKYKLVSIRKIIAMYGVRKDNEREKCGLIHYSHHF